MNLLSVGSVIKVNGIDLIVLGYRDIQDKEFKFNYVVALFPIGFIGQQESISLLPIDAKYEVVADGYKDETGERFLERSIKKIETLRNSSPEEVEKVLDMIVEKYGVEKDD